MIAALRRRFERGAALAACGAAALLLAGCSGQGPLACPGSQRYANSRTIGPWRIPDDLSSPKEADALQIPAVPGQNQPSASTAGSGAPCLESPPVYREGDDQAQTPRSAPPRGAEPAEGRRRARRRSGP